MNSQSHDSSIAATAALAPTNASRIVDNFFSITERHTTVSREIVAGISTFVALSYIFVVNPAILSAAGVPYGAALFATILLAGAATLAMGLWANLPFAVAPGMEMNAYFSFFVVSGLGFSWQQGLGMVFWSGVLMLLVTATGARKKVIDSIPESVKIGLALCVGVFLILVAGKISGILAYEGVKLTGIGQLTSSAAIAVYIGVATIIALERLRVPGAVLLSVFAASIFCFFTGEMKFATTKNPTSEYLSALGAFDPRVLLNPKSFAVILVLFLLDFYGSVAKFIGLMLNTGAVRDGKLPGMTKGLYVDGAATSLGAVFGTSSLIAYVESAVGIGAGGRTGLTAVVIGVLMVLCFAAAPWLSYIPTVATGGALIYVGYKLCPDIERLRKATKIDLLILIVMPLLVVATFSLDRAMLAGFSLSIVACIAAKTRPNPYLVASALALAVGILAQVLSS